MKPLALIAALLLATPAVAEPAELEGCALLTERYRLVQHDDGTLGIAGSVADEIDGHPGMKNVFVYHQGLCGMPIYKHEWELWLGEES